MTHDTGVTPAPPPWEAEAPGLLLCSLLHSGAMQVNEIARLVFADDMNEPGATIYDAVIGLAAKGVNPIPTLVCDELSRRGLLDSCVARWLTVATTARAEASAARMLAAVVVATRLRHVVESFGNALVTSAHSGPEVVLPVLAENAAKQIIAIGERLDTLRGES